MTQSSNSPGLHARDLVVGILIVMVALGSSRLRAQDHPETFAEVNGAKLWYKTEGQGEPLLLLPGGPGLSHLYFTPHFAELSDKLQVIYLDPYGRGKSDRAASPSEYTLVRDVDDLEAFREYLGIDRLNLFGHSYGGIVAQAYVLKYPQRVGKIILANTMFSSDMYQAAIDNLNQQIQNQNPDVWQHLQGLHERDQKSSTPEFLMAFMPAATPLAYFYNPSNAARLVGDPTSFNPDVLFTMAGEDLGFTAGGDLGSFDFTDRLPQIEVPVLVIAGRFDRLCFPRFTEQFKDHLPSASFVMFEQSGHFPFIEEPDRMLETIDTFMSE